MNGNQMMSIFLTALALFGSLRSFAQQATAQNSAFVMKREGRIHNREGLTGLRINLKDSDIYSPKSVTFSKDGTKFYIHSLEGGKTLVYSYPQFQKLKVISHRFTEKQAHLFQDETTVFGYPYYQNLSENEKNIFIGKPVESALSHGGRYLWVTYYRRSYDESAQSPSALAIIDTEKDEIVRVMPTGPIPKYVAISQDSQIAAIVHWGDNTVSLMDISASDPNNFRYLNHVAVGEQLSQNELAGTNRDSTCGFCLRGAVFSSDNRHLLVAKMSKGGGIAGIDVEHGKYLGAINSFAPTPRHLVLDPQSETLFVSSNASGVISKIKIDVVLTELLKANGKNLSVALPGIQSVDLGSGARTIDLTPDGKTLFVALNSSQVLSAIDAETLTPLAEISVDPYPVGLAVSPDGKVVLVTSQGVRGKGGNSVNIVTFERTDIDYRVISH